MSPALVFLLNLISTWYLVGLIWTIQIVHYSLFDRIGEESFTRYEADHVRLITPVVGPAMLVELATSAMLVIWAPTAVPRWGVWVGLIAVAAIWLSTVAIQVPCHERLGNGFRQSDYELLVNSNWIRTVLWTLRGILLSFFAVRLM